jgi:hypothetical protein
VNSRNQHAKNGCNDMFKIIEGKTKRKNKNTLKRISSFKPVKIN